jgi:hypothetical protein
MNQDSLASDIIPQREYLKRTSGYYLDTLDTGIRSSFSEEQLGAVRQLLDAAIPKPQPKLVDLRFGVDLLFTKYFVVLFVGRDYRQQKRTHFPERVSRLGNIIVASLLLIGLNLLISLFVLLLAYLVKSALDIDLIPNAHLADQLHKWQ